MTILEITLQQKCLLELDIDYRKPSLFVNEGNGTFSIRGEVPKLHVLTFLTYTTGRVRMLRGRHQSLSAMDLMV